MGDMSNEQLMELFPCRMRRKFNRGLKRKPMALIKKLRKKKRECPANEKPDVVKTHLRNMVIMPEMTGSIVGVYNGKTFNQVEINPEMIGHYLGEFSITYKPVKHGRPGIGATHSSRFERRTRVDLLSSVSGVSGQMLASQQQTSQGGILSLSRCCKINGSPENCGTFPV